jgi:uncharacterized protein (DUF983 family)
MNQKKDYDLVKSFQISIMMGVILVAMAFSIDLLIFTQVPLWLTIVAGIGIVLEIPLCTVLLIHTYRKVKKALLEIN